MITKSVIQVFVSLLGFRALWLLSELVNILHTDVSTFG